MRVRIFLMILPIIFFLANSFSFSQITDPMNGAPPPCQPWPDCQDEIPPRAPITGPILALLAGGIGFGIRTISKRKKN